jgi:CheY-like chemotaxis protein
VDLVITDQNMPKMDGLTLVRSLPRALRLQEHPDPAAHHRVVGQHEAAGAAPPAPPAGW